MRERIRHILDSYRHSPLPLVCVIQFMIARAMKEIDLLRRACILAIATFAIPLFGSSASAQQPYSGEQQKVVVVISSFMAAFHEEDLTKLNSLVTPNFYIFDNGKRFTTDSVMSMIKGLHAAGKQIEWHVTEPDVHLEGSAAWIGYINKGTITSDSVTVDQQWLESAFLVKQSGAWKIEFLHSTRAAPAPPQSK